jgi:DnaJ-class molecular chaperone
MLSSRSASLTALRRRVPWATNHCRRHFVVDTKGNDRQAPSFYDTLGLDALDQPTARDVRLAFIREARKLSDAATNRDEATRRSTEAPSQHVATVRIPESREAAAQMARLVRAYRSLSSDDRRVRYTQHAGCSLDSTLGIAHEDGAFSQFDHRHQKFYFSDTSAKPIGDYTKAFRDVAGWDATGGQNSEFSVHSNGGASSNSAASPGHNIDVLLHLSFAEAHLGCTKTLQYTRLTECGPCKGSGSTRRGGMRCVQCKGRGSTELPSGSYLVVNECAFCLGKGSVPPPRCKTCRGTGTADEQATLQVAIEPGAASGQSLKFRAGGNAGGNNAPSGKLVVTLVVDDHRLFHRAGSDLHIAVPVSVSLAVLGGVVAVPTLQGKASVTVPPGAGNGQVVTLSGMGMARDGAGGATGHGDLRVHLVVVIPSGDELTGAQRRAVFEGLVPAGVDHTAEVAFSEAELSDAKLQFRAWLPLDGEGF